MMAPWSGVDLPVFSPNLRRRTKRLQQVVDGPYRSGISAQGEPVRSRQQMPFSTRRSSARGTPRGLFGNNAAMIDHSKSVSSYRRGVMIAPLRSLNHISPTEGIPFMSL